MGAHSPPAVAGGSLDVNVAGLLEGGEMLGQPRVRQPELVAHEGELDPVGGRQQRDDREPFGFAGDLSRRPSAPLAQR